MLARRLCYQSRFFISTSINVSGGVPSPTPTILLMTEATWSISQKLQDKLHLCSNTGTANMLDKHLFIPFSIHGEITPHSLPSLMDGVVQSCMMRVVCTVLMSGHQHPAKHSSCVLHPYGCRGLRDGIIWPFSNLFCSLQLAANGLMRQCGFRKWPLLIVMSQGTTDSNK